ncbi:MAG: hemolysin secretion protein D, partial [Arenimonas sp.]
QNAVIKIDAFPYTRYGYLTAKVVSISHDAVQDEKLGLVFLTHLRLDRNSLEIEGTPVRLTAGMSLSVEVKTGQRRVIDYLISPLKDYATTSMHER